MEQVLILLVVFAGVHHAILSAAEPETVCIATQDATCSAALGGSVYIQVMPNARDHLVFFKKLNSQKIVPLLSLRKNTVTLSEEFKSRAQFFIDEGTLKILNVDYSDVGQYSVEVYLNGVHLRTTFVHLYLQETVCIAIQNTSCSVALGRPAYIQVMTNSSGHQVRIKRQNGTKTVFNLKKQGMSFFGEFKSRAHFFIDNGTLQIQNVERSDSGQYSVEIFSNGVHLRNTFFQLQVQEETSSFIFIIVGAALGLLLLVLLIICICKCCNRKKSAHQRNTTILF